MADPSFASGIDANAETPIYGIDDDHFRRELIALIPSLRAFSRSLCGHRELADDIAQEALAKAWEARATYEAGTNLKAWLFTIFRNAFYSNRRRSWRNIGWDDGLAETIPSSRDSQVWALQLSDMLRALDSLRPEQREALILIAVGDFTYEEAARITGVPVGTVKSRVSRARAALPTILEGQLATKRIDQKKADALNGFMDELKRLTT